MNYHTLQVYKYMNPGKRNIVQEEYQKRFNNKLSLVTHLKYDIDGFIFPLYLVPIREILLDADEIYQKSLRISDLTNRLSKFSQESFFWGNLRREIRSTNQIEGLHTTTLEINTAINHALRNSKKHVHFEPFARMYLNINNGRKLSIHKLIDVRKIYDNLFKGIFNAKIFPKKTLFRNNFIRIGNSSQTVYTPKPKEQLFKPDLIDWISFMNDSKMPSLIKACIAHFFFESIHPFNDGNGRTGRYILCTYLGSKLDKFTAISFSQEINRNEAPYYKAFQTLDNPVNHGEMTFFVLSMFKIIIKAQIHLISDVKGKALDLARAEAAFQSYKLSHDCSLIFLCLAKVQIFNQKDMATNISDLRRIFNYRLSNYKIRKALHQLSSKNLIQLIKQKPLTAVIPNHQLDKMCGITDIQK